MQAWSRRPAVPYRTQCDCRGGTCGDPCRGTAGGSVVGRRSHTSPAGLNNQQPPKPPFVKRLRTIPGGSRCRCRSHTPTRDAAHSRHSSTTAQRVASSAATQRGSVMVMVTADRCVTFARPRNDPTQPPDARQGRHWSAPGQPSETTARSRWRASCESGAVIDAVIVIAG